MDEIAELRAQFEAFKAEVSARLFDLSGREGKMCAKCGAEFTPTGERPGKQKYCPACSHGSQNKYKERQRAAVRAVSKEGLSLEEAAERYGLKRERLEAILSGEKSI